MDRKKIDHKALAHFMDRTAEDLTITLNSADLRNLINALHLAEDASLFQGTGERRGFMQDRERWTDEPGVHSMATGEREDWRELAGRIDEVLKRALKSRRAAWQAIEKD